MNTTDIRRVVLTMDDSDVQRRTENLTRRLTNAKRIKDQLETKAATGQLTKQETRDLAKFTKEVNLCERELSKLRSTKQQTERVLSNLSSAGPRELRNTLRALNRELENGAVKRGTAEWEQYQQAIREVNTELEKVQAEQRAATSFSSNFGDFISKTANLAMTIQGVMAAMTGLKSTVQGAVQAYADMQEAQADVRKYTGMTTEQVDDLNESLKRMDTRTSREQLNALAGDAGRLGIQSKQDILDFVAAADMINVALGEDLGEDAVKNIGKLAQLYGEDKTMGLKQAMLATGSAINELAQNSAASEPYLLDFTARLAGVGKQAGISQADIMGFAAVLDESMLRDETASTALQQLIVKIFQKPAEMAQAAGLEVKAFADLVRTDANAALLQFFEAMKARGGFDSLAPMFEQMHLNGQRAVGVLSAVADKTDLLRERQRLANEAYRDGTSIQSEFDVKNNTVQASLDKARKRFNELAVELGQKLLPLVRDGIHLTSGILRLLSSTISFVGRNAATLATLTAMVAAYTIAVNYATIATNAKKAAMVAINGITKAYTATVKALHAAHLLLQLGLAKLQGHWPRQSRLMLDVKAAGASLAKGWGLLAAAGVALVGILIQTIKKLGELSAGEKVLRKVREEAAGKIAEEKLKLEMLVAVARDETRSLADRQAAIKELNRIVPQYNGHLDTTSGKYRENKKALDDYIKSLIHLYEIEGAKEELKRIGRERAQNVVKEKTALDDKSHAQQTIGQYYDRSSINSYVAYGTAGVSVAQLSSISNSAVRQAEALLGKANKTIADVKRSNERLAQEEQAIIDAYGRDIQTSVLQQGSVPGVTPPTISGGGGGGGGGTTTGSTGGGGGTVIDPVKAASDQLEADARAARVAAQVQYQAGVLTKKQYDAELLRIETDMLAKQQALYKEGSDEWNKYAERLFQQQQAIKKKEEEWSLDDIAREEQEEIRAAKERYAKLELTEEQYNQRINEIKIDFLRRRANYFKSVGDVEQEANFNNQADDEDLAQRLARQQKFLQQAEKLQAEYLKKTLDEQEALEMDLLGRLYQAGIINADEVVRYTNEISAKYAKQRADKEKADKENADRDKEEADERRGKLKDALKEAGAPTDPWAESLLNIGRLIESLQEKLKDGEAAWQDYAAVGVASLGLLMTMAGSVSNLFQAQQQAEEKAVTAKYDKQIEAAGQDSKKGKRLEEEKQKSLAKIKNKYNSKAMAMEIAQATASAAMAAINAYASAAKIPVIGWKIAPVAAAMALASGAVQIATIRKQHEAQQEGYARGGFTGGTDPRREAGVVHEGEFVASAEAVGNPQLLPVLRLIDQAQRNRTVARLTAQDVSRTLSGGAAMASAVQTSAGQAAQGAQGQPATVHVDVAATPDARTAEALERLASRLEEPIETYVTIDGPQGLHRQLERYRKLLK